MSVVETPNILAKSVKEVLMLECEPLYTQKAVCRAYLAVRDRCVASVKELASMLGIKYHTAHRVSLGLNR